MRPILFSLHLASHEIALPSYGALVAIGFALGIVMFWRRGLRAGFDGGRLLDLAFWSIVFGLVGARLTFVIVNAHEFWDACFAANAQATPDPHVSGCLAIVRFWEGGLVFYGGALGAGGVIYAFCRKERWSFLGLGDLAAAPVAWGHAFGRIGCFLAGCCYGKPSSLSWAASFPPGSIAFDEEMAAGHLAFGASRTPGLHPTQIYESIGEFLLFGLLLFLEYRLPRDQRRERRPGDLLFTYVAAYAALRFFVELFRGDGARGFVFRWLCPRAAEWMGLPPGEPLLLSTSQLARLLVIAGLAFVLHRRRNSSGPR